eukprot:maker-scaffold1971_size23625-snap-gene-0.2 protein:Tk00849 transcript:maker-scaffold1971_size23625-snap-gene-0.2-mRNA-1 annotation:"transient receptor potential-gamma protein isoform x7"
MLANTSDDLLNINCCDPLGRSALLMAIDNENLEMVETKDALLHSINEEFVEAVEVLLDYEQRHRGGEIPSWEAIPPDTATFTPDITPLVLAAHRDNYEIIKILLDRGFVLAVPHDVRCGCEECMTSRQDDSLRHSRSRINAYRALASPSLIALSSKDPILTAFQLSWTLRRLSFAEHEFKSEYLELRNQCQQFATSLLDHTRSSYELEILLNHDPTGPLYQHGERMHLNRLKLAIKFRQKKFVAHPNVQQLLASIWYEGLPGFRQKNMILQFLEVCRIGLLFPFFSLAYIICPWMSFSLKLRKPFIKFICTSASYFTFLFLLILASQRIEVVIAEWFQNERLKQWLSNDVTTKRGSTPTLVEWAILAWVAGLIWSEIKQLWDVGLREYINDMWNVIDFVTNSLYVATIALRIVAYYKVQEELRVGSKTAHLPREHWDTWDPMLISEGLFAAANIFSNLKLVYIFSVNPYLGPLQVSLSRMVMDILKFISLFVLVLFAFSCGANQLLWYYADLEKQRCYNQQESIESELMYDNSSYSQPGVIQHDINHCLAWRRFANLWETSQTLFWAIFGLIDLDNFELTGIKEFTRFSGLLMFGSFSVINIIVLLNLLIAMMNHSYQLISVSSEKADVEWKFARSKLWISYFEEGGTVPPPFNIIPTPKSVFYLLKWALTRLCGRASKIKKEHLKTVRWERALIQIILNMLNHYGAGTKKEMTRKKVRQASERDFKYQAIMKNLVRRYVTQEQRKAENEGVTEDDVNEIKNDISAFRFEFIDIMRQTGHKVDTITGLHGGMGRKDRLKTRRILKGVGVGADIAGVGSTFSTEASVSQSACNTLVKRTSLTVDGFPHSSSTDMTNENLRRSPIAKFAYRLAGGHRSGETSLSSSFRSKNKGSRLSTQSSDDSHESNQAQIHEEPVRDLVGNALRSGSRREKFSKGRNPVQCLNPLQLQAPGSVTKAVSLSTATDIELGESSTRTLRTNDDDLIGEEEEPMDDDDDDDDDPPQMSLDSTASPFGGLYKRGGLAGMHRMFQVDLNDTLDDISRHEVAPLISSDSAQEKWASSTKSTCSSLILEPSHKALDSVSDSGTKAQNGGASSKSTTLSSSTNAIASSSGPKSKTVMPGLKPSAKNSNSGWL